MTCKYDNELVLEAVLRFKEADLKLDVTRWVPWFMQLVT